MFPNVFKYERRGRAEWNEIKEQIGEEPQRSLFKTDSDYEGTRDGYRRALSKTEFYREFVKDKIERGQRTSILVGKLYTVYILCIYCRLQKQIWRAVKS